MGIAHSQQLGQDRARQQGLSTPAVIHGFSGTSISEKRALLVDELREVSF